MFSSLRNRIHTFFEKYPRLASGITGFCTFSAGDVLAQRLEMTQNKSKTFDYKRPIQIGFLGLVSNGYFLTKWYQLLDNVAGTSMTSKKTVFSKVIADQLVYAPFAILSFFSFTSYLTESNLSKAWNHFKITTEERFFPTFFADCTVWPLANFVNFRVIPLVYRASFTAFVQLLWQGYLSFVSHADDDKVAASDLHVVVKTAIAVPSTAVVAVKHDESKARIGNSETTDV
jgi:protein Mpv17